MDSRFHKASPPVNGKIHGIFRRALQRWYRRGHRWLPWRETSDPYRIWISEVMLQQTRVEAVRPYYERWMREFPTLEQLARAPYERVLKLWEGLGYYQRARNLHQTARLVMRNHGGQLPADPAQLRQLPGIGPYTVGAIASIAFGLPVPAVDGNVMRVLARVFLIEESVALTATRRHLWALAATLMPIPTAARPTVRRSTARTRPVVNEAGDFNQALMELGAMICTPVRPSCGRCPLRSICQARTRGAIARLPNSGPRPKIRPVTASVALARRGSRLLLRRRPGTGLWAHLWELPPLNRRWFDAGHCLHERRFGITDRRVTLRVFACRPRRQFSSEDRWRWCTTKDLDRLALPRAHRQALESLCTTKH